MLWVIQRDFLQGKSVQELVKEALAPVPNPSHDKAIADTNAIRASLTSIARNSTGYRYMMMPRGERVVVCGVFPAALVSSGGECVMVLNVLQTTLMP